MDLSKIKNPIIIQGFPGVGLVGSIAIEYLINHLNCQLIGRHYFEDVPATIAIHKGRIIYPINIYYSKSNNFVLVHSVIATPGLEWKMAKFISDIAEKTNAKEVICLEGVGNPELIKQNVYHYTTNEKKKKSLKDICPELSEGILVGVTPAMMVMHKKDVTAFFADTASNMPDSKAAAKIIECMDKYLQLQVDPLPLLKQATEFEDKLKVIMEKGQKAQDELQQMSYVG